MPLIISILGNGNKGRNSRGSLTLSWLSSTLNSIKQNAATNVFRSVGLRRSGRRSHSWANLDAFDSASINCQLPTANCQLSTANCHPPASSLRLTPWPIRSADLRPPRLTRGAARLGVRNRINARCFRRFRDAELSPHPRGHQIRFCS